MEQRHQKLLKLIIETYVETGEPVGSKFLVETEGLTVSGATVRNDMRELEDAGYLMHPHTSAGRIPTEAGYRYYIAQLMESKPLKKKAQDALDPLIEERKHHDERETEKSIGKIISDMTHSAVIIAWDAESIYYTGLANLFSQQEFRDYQMTVSVSSVLDQCEEEIERVLEQVPYRSVEILIGSENPLGSACGIVVARYKPESFFAVLGPLRMAYGETMALVKYAFENR
ncbi:MAG: hypothetical protein AAB932_04320 [Patescibacteria group bacterium]